MKRKWSTIYAAFVTLLLATGFLLVFYFAQKNSVGAMIACLIGLFTGFVLAPIVHEIGHMLFACTQNMRVVYAKSFCFQICEQTGKRRFALASPFAPDQTQAIPKNGGDMQKRATAYTLGGLILGGLFFIIALILAIIFNEFFLWGILPYAGYLVLLNIAPCYYASGKTDMFVCIGLKKGYDAEKTMLSAMEIQGRLYAGERFSDIEKKWYFDLPQLAEDEPLYAVILDLRYRYYLDKGDILGASDCLNRLICAQAYLQSEEREKLAAELTYIYTLQNDRENAEESGKYARGFLQGDSATAKRVLLAFTLAFGGEERKETVETLKKQAEIAIANERIKGVALLEQELVSRLA